MTAVAPHSVVPSSFPPVKRSRGSRFGTIVFATYSGVYFWFPKMTGRLLDERLGRLHFWTTSSGSI